MQQARVLLEIGSQDKRAAFAEQPTGPTQERRGIRGLQISDRGTWKEAEAPARRMADRGQRRQHHVVGAYGFDRQRRIITPETPCGFVEMLAGNIDRCIDRKIRERIEQQARLHAGAAAELHQGAARTGQGRDLPCALAQDRGFGAGEVIFRQPADIVEQRRTTGVIEKLGGNGSRRAGQPVQHRLPKFLAIGRLGDLERQHLSVHRRSSAKRIPPNIQRASGGKKLR